MNTSDKSTKLRSEFIALLNHIKSNPFNASKIEINNNENKKNRMIMNEDLVHHINDYDNIHASYGGRLPLDPLCRHGSINILSDRVFKTKPYIIPSDMPSFHAYLLYKKELKDKGIV